MAAKDARVELRVSAATKARWVEAAGGPRRVSAWLTELADAASSPDAAEALVALGAQVKLAKAALPLVTPILPTLDLTQVERHPLNVGTPSDAAPADQSEPGAVISGSRSEHEGESQDPPECPRWMHHRKGVYCGTCKRVN